MLSSAFDLLLIFLHSLIQTLTLTPPPNNTLLETWTIHVSGVAKAGPGRARVQPKFVPLMSRDFARSARER